MGNHVLLDRVRPEAYSWENATRAALVKETLFFTD